MLAALAAVTSAGHTAPPDDIVKSIMVPAGLPAVWSAWTTDDGVREWFSRGSNVESFAGGEYEILCTLDNPRDQRGAENTSVLAIEPERRLVFTWSAPPAWPDIRKQRRVVEISLRPADNDSTIVELRHTLWGDGDRWSEVNAYFDEAWSVVLYRLAWRFRHGPVDWDDPPRPVL